MSSRRAGKLRPTAVNSILAEVRALKARGGDPVSLMRGEPDLPTPEHIREAAIASLRAGRTQYADNRGEPRLREAVAEKLQRDNGLRYDPETEILATTGATLGVWAALAAILDEGDEVLLPDPVYDAYHSPIVLAGGRPRRAPSEIRNGRFEVSAEAVEAACGPRAKALLLNSPWNPAGTVFTRGELEKIGEVVLRRGLTLLSDEIYEAIVYDGAVHISPAALSPELRSRTVLINSLSKTYSMTGWRVGYCAAPAETIRAMLLVLQQSSRGAATFVQDAAAAALAGPQDCVREMQAEYARRRQKVIDALGGLGKARVMRPEGGFFAMLDVRAAGTSSEELRRRLLHEAGVVVIHGGAYGERGEGTLRVSFASGGKLLDEGLARLRSGLEQL